MVSDRIALYFNVLYLRMKVENGGVCRLSYSIDGDEFTTVGGSFTLREGMWIGAKMGFYALREGAINDAGAVDIDWFRIEK